MSRQDQNYNNARNKSKGPEKKTSKDKVIRIPEKNLKKLMVSSFVAGAIAVILLTGSIKLVGKIGEGIHDYYTIKDIRIEQSMKANSLLAANDLNVVPAHWDNGEWNNNYARIEELSENDLYGLICYLGGDESNAIVRVLGYDDFDQFLIEKGHTDEKGEPSRSAWMSSEESRLIAEKTATKEKGQ